MMRWLRGPIGMLLLAIATAGATPASAAGDSKPVLPKTGNAEDIFRVTLLGTGTPQIEADRYGPSTLVEAGHQRLLFDAGRGAAIRLSQIKIRPAQINVLFLTHYHSDHVTGIPDLWLTGWLPAGGRRKQPFQVIGPTGANELMENLKRAFAADIRIRIADQHLPPAGADVSVKEFASDGVVYERDGVKVTAFEVDHGPKIKPAYGYRIDYAGRSVVLSGDTRFNKNVIHYGTGVDLLIHEVGMAKPELLKNPVFQRILAHHTLPSEAAMVFNQAKPKLAVYTHFTQLGTPKIPAPTAQDIFAETRKTYSGPLQLGEDLMSFNVRATGVKVVPPARAIFSAGHGQ
jgi:ribonuclease Z